MKRKIFLEIVCGLVILLFIYAATSKIIDYKEFKIQLGKSPFIHDYSGLVAWAIPVGEIVVGISLAFAKTRLLGLYGSLFLMTMFSVYIYMMLHYSYYIPCSCGGILSKMGWTAHFWFNIGFVALSIIGIILQVVELRNRQVQNIQPAKQVQPEYAAIM